MSAWYKKLSPKTYPKKEESPYAKHGSPKKKKRDMNMKVNKSHRYILKGRYV